MKLGEQGFTHPKNQEVFITADSAAPETHKGKLRNGDTLCVAGCKSSLQVGHKIINV